MCNYVHYTTTTIWNHKHNKNNNNNNNNCKLRGIGAFSEVINVWLTCPVAQHQMTACKAGHNVKLLWRWQFWMGSHFRHCLANSWPAVTDSFNWGFYLKGYLSTWSHILYLSLHLTSTWGGLSERTSSENLSSQMFRCGHQKGVFALHKTNKYYDNSICLMLLSGFTHFIW